MKFGIMSNSCMSISQNPDMMRMNANSRGWSRLRSVTRATRRMPPD